MTGAQLTFYFFGLVCCALFAWRGSINGSRKWGFAVGAGLFAYGAAALVLT